MPWALTIGRRKPAGGRVERYPHVVDCRSRNPRNCRAPPLRLPSADPHTGVTLRARRATLRCQIIITRQATRRQDRSPSVRTAATRSGVRRIALITGMAAGGWQAGGMDIADLLVDAFGRVREAVHGAVDRAHRGAARRAARPRSQLDRVAGLAPHPGAGRPRRRRRRASSRSTPRRAGRSGSTSPSTTPRSATARAAPTSPPSAWPIPRCCSTTTRTSTGRRWSTCAA